MLRFFLELFQRQKPENTSRSSREVKPTSKEDTVDKSTNSSRDGATPHFGMPDFESFRHMLKDFSKRLEAIKENPQEAYLINTEIAFRVLGVLENLVLHTERNAIALENLPTPFSIKKDTHLDSVQKRRAREVLTILEKCGELTYEELRKEIKPVISYKRVTALVSEMIRDGIPLLREGKPVRVRLKPS